MHQTLISGNPPWNFSSWKTSCTMRSWLLISWINIGTSLTKPYLASPGPTFSARVLTSSSKLTMTFSYYRTTFYLSCTHFRRKTSLAAVVGGTQNRITTQNSGFTSPNRNIPGLHFFSFYSKFKTCVTLYLIRINEKMKQKQLCSEIIVIEED